MVGPVPNRIFSRHIDCHVTPFRAAVLMCMVSTVTTPIRVTDPGGLR